MRLLTTRPNANQETKKKKENKRGNCTVKNIQHNKKRVTIITSFSNELANNCRDCSIAM